MTALARTRLSVAFKSLDASQKGLAASILFASLVLAFLLASSHVVLAGIVASLPLLTLVTVRGVASIARRGAVAFVGVVWFALFASTFVWRTRSTQELDANPLDTAGRIRVALVVLAGLLAAIALCWPRASRPRIPLALSLLAAYIAIGYVSALGSPLPLQAGYRAFELSIGMLAALAGLMLLGPRAGEVLLRLMIGLVAASVAVIWIEAIAVPHAAWAHTVSAFPYELQGYLPQYSSNSVGTLGGLLGLYGLARPSASRRGQIFATVALAVGAFTLLAAQYRTGILAFLVAGSAVAWYRQKLTFAVLWIVVALAISAVGVAPTVAHAKQIFSKGRPELVGTLDDRTVYWHASKPLIRERPYLGWGLNVGSRRVLVSLGKSDISTIHSTWIEALLGTGFIGTFFLAAAYAAAVARAWRVRAHPLGAAVFGLLLFYCVRTITGPTTEIFDIGFLFFAALICAGDQLARARVTARVAGPSVVIHSRRGAYT
jgi:O-antigen ligase